MAVLQKIRNKPKLLIGIIAIALLAFIFPWNEVTSFINRQKNRAFTAGGEDVSMETYQNRVASFIELQKVLNPNISLDDDATAQIRLYIYQQLLNETMLNVEGEKTGLTVTEDEMQDLVFGTNPSPILSQIPFLVDQQTRQVSPEAVNQFVTTANTNPNSVPVEQRSQIELVKSIWDNIQNMIKYGRLEQKFNALLANTILVNNIEIAANTEAAATTSNIAYVLNRYSSIPDSTVTVTNKEIEKLYNDRKNSFKTNDQMREISYLTKQIVPSEDDYKQAYDEINKAIERLNSSTNPALTLADYPEVPFKEIYYSLQDLSKESSDFVKNASIGETYGPLRLTDSYDAYKLLDKKVAPDSIKFSIMGLPLTMNADSIISVINNGKSFATLANEINPGSNVGQAQWATEAALGQDPNLNKAILDQIFNTPVGSIAKLNIQGANVLLNVEAKSQPINKYLVATVRIPITISDATYALTDNELNQFVASANAQTFVKEAQDKGYNIVPKTFINSSQINLNQIPGSRQIIFWAFNEKVGNIKKFDLSDYRVIALIDSKEDKGYLPLSAVEESLKTELINDKKAEKMIADLTAKNLTSLTAYAQSISYVKVDTAKFVTFETSNIMGVGKEPILNVYSELGEINKLSQPLKGTNGVLVINVLDRTKDTKEPNTEQYKQSTNSQNYYLVMTQGMKSLQDKMNVKSNLISFF